MSHQLLTFTVNSVGPLLIKSGDMVDFTTPLCRTSERKTYRIHISKYLGIEPKDIFLHLQKVVGEPIDRDEVIAAKKTRFGSKSYQSEFDGVIQEINHHEGIVTIETSSEVDDMTHAYFRGPVEKVIDKAVSLRVSRFVSFPLRSAKLGFGGEIKFVESEQNLALLNHDSIRGRVIITKSIGPIDAVRLEVLDEAGTLVLEEPPVDSPDNKARIANPQDWATIHSVGLPYCIVDAAQSTIHFYES